MFRLIFACVVLLAAVVPANASCFRRGCYSTVYHEVEQYFVPVAVPVVQPAVFQYLPALNLPTIVPTVGVNPVVPTAPVAPSAPGQQPVGKMMTEADIEKLVEKRVAEKQFAALRNSEEGPPPVPDGRVGAGAANTQVASEERATAIGILSGTCARCHTEGRLSGNVQLFNSRGVFAPSVDVDTILDAVQTARMPKAAAGNTKHSSAIRGKALATLINGLK